MKNEFDKWREYLCESEKAVHDRYEAKLYISISQSKDIDRTDIMNQIRAIPEVTTVYRDREISTSKENFVGEYILRFVLRKGTSPDHYYARTLLPRLKNINGLSVQKSFGFDKMEGYL